MKTKLTAAFLLLASIPVSYAASQVTLYGVLDGGVLVSKAKHDDTKVDMKSGFTAGPRWGIKGEEDLGSGYSVGFILEQGFNLDTGEAASSTKAFNRETALYVKGGFGKVTFGRLGTLGFAQSTGMLRGAVFGTTWGASAWNKSNYGVNFDRADNSVAYVTPSFNGATLHLMYSNGISGDEAKWNKNSHYYGVGGKYTAGPADASIIFEANDNKGTDGAKTMYHITAGGSWNFGPAKAFAIYQYATQENLWKQHYIGLGTDIKAGGGTLKVGGKYIYRKADGSNKILEKGSASRKADVWTLGLGYTYPFSKRTNLWAYGGYTDGGKAWKDKASVYFNGWQLGAGLKTTF